ncbi:hypothetical protein [Nocardia miyunensis]|uniref:hypothetical protein n=1 Tax=Nocardia miyunensis TaxID=282684 RepID=UPI000ABBD948|nr:hypothetical protein [Nocardia miyunensis]
MNNFKNSRRATVVLAALAVSFVALPGAPAEGNAISVRPVVGVCDLTPPPIFTPPECR